MAKELHAGNIARGNINAGSVPASDAANYWAPTFSIGIFCIRGGL
jgi:hypothetical protein